VPVLVAAAGFVPAGCGEAPPPPMTKENFEAQKSAQEKMLMKEYGLDKTKTPPAAAKP
jgi:hypothetical protein